MYTRRVASRSFEYFHHSKYSVLHTRNSSSTGFYEYLHCFTHITLPIQTGNQVAINFDKTNHTLHPIQHSSNITTRYLASSECVSVGLRNILKQENKLLTQITINNIRSRFPPSFLTLKMKFISSLYFIT